MKFTHTQHITGYTVTLWHCGLLGKPCAMRKERYCCLNKVYSVSDQGQSENIRKRLISWWMDGQTDGQIDGQRDGRTNGQGDVEMDRETDKRTSRGSNGRMDRQTERRTDGLTDGGTDGLIDDRMDWGMDSNGTEGGRERQTDGSTDECLMQRRREWEARHGQTDGRMDGLISLGYFQHWSLVRIVTTTKCKTFGTIIS